MCQRRRRTVGYPGYLCQRVELIRDFGDSSSFWKHPRYRKQDKSGGVSTRRVTKYGSQHTNNQLVEL